MAFNLGQAVQDILTKGIDAAASIKLAQLQVNNPAPSVQGPNGQRVAAGTVAGSSVVASIPTWVWGAAAIAALVLVVPRLIKR